MRLLEAAPVDSVLRVPVDSPTQTKSWQGYEAALRAAAIWWPAHRAGLRMAEKRLAGFNGGQEHRVLHSGA